MILLEGDKKSIAERTESVISDKSVTCTICDKKFVAKKTLNRHMRSVHEGKKPFKCDTCDKSFSQKTGLNSHIVTHHSLEKPDKSFICSICNARFCAKKSLARHIATVHTMAGLIDLSPLSAK